MTATLFTSGKFRAFDANGAPLNGGLLNSYQAGTTIRQNTFTDQSGTVANANPVVLDSTGQADVWITGNYKFVLTDALGNQQWSEDNISDTLFTNAFSATSTTSNTIGTGTQTFITQSGKSFTVGQYLIFIPTSNTSYYEVGAITAYTGTTLTVNITAVNGTGTFTSWNIALGAPSNSNVAAINTTQTTLASATTTDLGTIPTQNVLITGTTTITSFGSSAILSSPLYYIEFQSALTLTYNATSLILPNLGNTNVSAGSTGLAEYLGSGNWKIRELNGGSSSVGFVTAYTSSSVPNGYLECNGAAISRTTYATLFAITSTTFGSGDGSTTFNLPDLRGYFVRGWDDGAGIDPGRAFGTTQADAFASHNHNWYSNNGGVTTGSTTFARTTSVATGNTGITDSSGGSETRPKNVAMMFCIRYQ